jgi:hypothetical protein
MVVGRKIALDRASRHETVAIEVAEHDLVIDDESGQRVAARTTEHPDERTKPTDLIRSEEVHGESSVPSREPAGCQQRTSWSGHALS